MSIVKKPRTTTVILFQGDDLDPIEDRRKAFERSLVEQVRTDGNRRAGDADLSGPKEAGREYDDFLEGAIERAAKVRLVALPKKMYRDMVTEHPPREDVKSEEGEVLESYTEDRRYGFNVDSMADVLVPPSVMRDPSDGYAHFDDIEPQFDSLAERDTWLDELSDAEFSKLYSAAILLNQGGGPDPKARFSSLIDQMSDETSPLPEPDTSPSTSSTSTPTET